MNNLSYFLILSLFFVAGCDLELNSTNEEESNIIRDEEGKIVSGEVKQYTPGGKLTSIINVKEYKLHGPAVKYYEDGTTVRSKLNYNMGNLEGMQKRYYKSGALYKEEPYVNGKRHGLVKKYRESGKIMTEVVYKNGQPGTELREYLTNGKLKQKYPSIVIKEIDNLRYNGVYTLKISMSDNSKNVKYYIGELDEGKFFSDNLIPERNVSKGILTVHFNLKPGDFLMKEFNVVARMPTRLNNAYITSRRHRLGIEFPLY